jgi:hypothetical protein
MFWIGFVCGFIAAPLVILLILFVTIFWSIHKNGFPFSH